ncbi:MAG: MobA/MobL family protein [Hydrococcus sp. SU_1_0]|nr:MobA/MobL family protein [Hydrococcus sp. SU_1_0]
MAIYHLSAQIIGRSAGRSATAAAAYRSGQELKNNLTGKVHNFTHRDRIDHSEILAPVTANWITDRNQLWNRVEGAEKRKDATLARELNIALPMELGRDNQIELVREFVRENFVDAGMIADINLHNLDDHNPHAHIMLTTRDLEIIGGDSEVGFEFEFGKKNRDWNDKKLLLSWRENWAKTCNKFLEREGIEDKIDHRSNETRGLETLPQIKVGLAATRLVEKGYHSDRVEHNNKIKAFNEKILEVDEIINEINLLTGDLINQPIEVPIEVINTVSDNTSTIPSKVLKKWEVGYQQSTSQLLIESLQKYFEQVDPSSNGLYDIHLGNYRGAIQIMDDGLVSFDIYYRDMLAVKIESKNDWFESKLLNNFCAVDQCEQEFSQNIQSEIDRLSLIQVEHNQQDELVAETEKLEVQELDIEKVIDLEFETDLDFGEVDNRTDRPSRGVNFDR